MKAAAGALLAGLVVLSSCRQAAPPPARLDLRSVDQWGQHFSIKFRSSVDLGVVAAPGAPSSAQPELLCSLDDSGAGVATGGRRYFRGQLRLVREAARSHDGQYLYAALGRFSEEVGTHVSHPIERRELDRAFAARPSVPCRVVAAHGSDPVAGSVVMEVPRAMLRMALARSDLGLRDEDDDSGTQ